eukprot:m.310655 g.310655  ORF g.310655 m.310655 type:complete len:298 (+) comp53489_c0_seq1:65-958(+)
MVVDFIAGWSGGAAGLLVGHPFDTVKVRLQMDGPEKKYRGIVDCVGKIIRKEGIFALYKGIATPLMGVAFLNSVAFGTYMSVLGVLGKGVGRYEHELRNVLIAGSAAGFFQSFLSSPVELSKVLLQIQTQPTGKAARAGHVREFSGPMDVYRKLLKRNGIRGLYTGLVSCLWRDVPGFTMYFASYHLLCTRLTPSGENTRDLSTLRLLTTGGLAGMASWTLFYPFDVIKSRIQGQEKGQNKLYNGMRDCFQKSIRNEGWRVLWKGWVPTQVRAFPSNAAVFYFYTLTHRFLERHVVT